LRYGSDLTARQIAAVLEMKTNAVEVALHRALKTLRVALEDGGARIGPARGDVKWAAQQPT
jgi:DNA-directed RNA polymerase specialized sigma24 family protein